MDKALRDKGLAMRKAVLGEDYVNKSLASADAFNGPFQEILNEYCCGPTSACPRRHARC